MGWLKRLLGIEKDVKPTRYDLNDGYYMEGYLYDSAKNMCLYKDGQLIRQITDEKAHFIDFPGVEHGSWENSLEVSMEPALRYGFFLKKFGEDGLAELIWRVQPDGRYYADEDGFGMSDQEEIMLRAKFDKTGKFVTPFRGKEEKKSDLSRFIEAQSFNYSDALREIKNGRKESCWIWYVFPQIQGLGQSDMSKRFAIQDLQEARDYLADETLGPRLEEMCRAALAVDCNDASQVFGTPDDMKLRSSMTLFEAAAPKREIFGMVLDKYFQGQRDMNTLRILLKKK